MLCHAVITAASRLPAARVLHCIFHRKVVLVYNSVAAFQLLLMIGTRQSKVQVVQGDVSHHVQTSHDVVACMLVAFVWHNELTILRVSVRTHDLAKLPHI